MTIIEKAFRDVSTAAQSLADERIPKDLKYKLKNPISPKVRAIIAKVASLTSGVAGASIGKYALRGGAKIAAAASGAEFIKSVNGSITKPLGSLQKAGSAFSVGVRVIEESDPTKLIRPIKDGPSINPAQAAKQLSETYARGIATSIVANVPLASGLPQARNVFKSLAKIKASPRFFDARKATAPTTTQQAISTAKIAIVKQRGLLEDEIMYRLVLLAENVYKPIFEYAVSNGYGAPIILEAMRSENSGLSQHERGEAMDLALQNNTPENLFNLCVWIRDNVLYDQLILCHSGIAGGQSWIHISFSPDVRRRQVLTKKFNDTFESGLHIYKAYQNMALRAQDQATAKEQDKLANDMIQRLAARDVKLNPVGVNTQEQLKDSTTTAAGSSSTGVDGRAGGATVPATPKPVYVGHPGGTCGLTAMFDHDDGGHEESPSFQEQVEEAQAEVILQYGANPLWFNTDGSVVDEVAYCTEVARVLKTYGFCAEAGGPPDEVGVKITNEWNDQYDLVNGATMQPHCLYTVTCRPARF